MAMIFLNCLGKTKQFCTVSAQLYVYKINVSLMTYSKPLKISVLVLVETGSILLKVILANVKALPLSPI